MNMNAPEKFLSLRVYTCYGGKGCNGEESQHISGRLAHKQQMALFSRVGMAARGCSLRRSSPSVVQHACWLRLRRSTAVPFPSSSPFLLTVLLRPHASLVSHEGSNG